MIISFVVPSGTSWIMQNRGEFDILVHPNSGGEKLDHSEWCLWLVVPSISVMYVERVT